MNEGRKEEWREREREIYIPSLLAVASTNSGCSLLHHRICGSCDVS